MAEAAKDLKLSLAVSYFDALVGWPRRAGQESEEWQRAALYGDRILHVTPDELVGLRQAIDELIEPYGRRLTNPDERPPGARDVTLVRFAFPSDPP